jgi:16S rRNA (cytosine1402-N4)-methyltransferase
VSFHSVEDRMVKRFVQLRSGRAGTGNRYAPEAEEEAPRFEMVTRRSVEPDESELSANPRARSARLRVARRTAAPAGRIRNEEIGMPILAETGRKSRRGT